MHNFIGLRLVAVDPGEHCGVTRITFTPSGPDIELLEVLEMQRLDELFKAASVVLLERGFNSGVHMNLSVFEWMGATKVVAQLNGTQAILQEPSVPSWVTTRFECRKPINLSQHQYDSCCHLIYFLYRNRAKYQEIWDQVRISLLTQVGAKI